MPQNLDTIWTEGRERVIVSGSFAPNGSSAVATTRTDTTALRGVGWTVARTSAGLFTITFNGGRRYNQLDCFVAFLQQATGGDQFVQGGSYTPPTATADGTITVRLWDISGAAVDDQAADANNRIHFLAVFRRLDVD
jgi:hypothetical protein